MNETIRKMPRVRTGMECERKRCSAKKRVYMPVVQIKKAIKALCGCGIAVSTIMLIGIAGTQDLNAAPIGQAVKDSMIWLAVLGLCAWVRSVIEEN